MKHPKVVVLGAGSLFFGRKAIWQMVHSPHLNSGTLALVDTDATRLNKMKRLAEMVIAHHDVPLALQASVERRDVLRDADFVILSFANRNTHFRRIDVELSAEFGIRMCSGDTIGPGGVLRTMRELPLIEAACKDIRELCPDAWVINYINPTAVHGIALKRFFPDLKTLALCDAQWHLRQRYAEAAAVPDDDKLEILSAGPNHFTWLLKATYDGQDLIPRIVEHMRAEAAHELRDVSEDNDIYSKTWLNNAVAVELYDVFGVLPTVVGHTKEYVRFYQRRGMARRDAIPPVKLFDTDLRTSRTNDAWRRVDEYLDGRADITSFDTEFGPDPATDLVEAMWAGLNKRFFVNTFNRGAVPNMADDAFLELYCSVDLQDGPTPLATGPMPRGVRSLCEQVLDTHELTARAVHDGDRSLLRRAMLTDPLANSIGDTDALFDRLLKAQRDGLPQHWFDDASATSAALVGRL
ncbi:MAG TPA: hypothetical protein VF184_01015 [Phycisphaeraceae bacterium]